MGEKEEDLDSKIVKIEKVKRNNVILKKFSEDLLGHLIDFNVFLGPMERVLPRVYFSL